MKHVSNEALITVNALLIRVRVVYEARHRCIDEVRAAVGAAHVTESN